MCGSAHRVLASQVAGFDDMTTQAKAVSVCAGIEYCQIAQGILKCNPASHVACSAIFPAGQYHFRQEV